MLKVEAFEAALWGTRSSESAGSDVLASGASATRSWTWAIKLGAQANRLFLKWSRQ